VEYPSRLAALSDLNDKIAEAEREVARWTRVVERMSAAREPTRAARSFLRVAQDDLDRLDRARDVLLEGEEREPRGRSAPSLVAAPADGRRARK
jgi:hypothetical protein